MDNSHNWGMPLRVSASGLHHKRGAPAGSRGKPWFKKPRDKTDDSASLISGLRLCTALNIIQGNPSGWNRFHAFHRPADPVQPASKPVMGEVRPDGNINDNILNAVYQLFKVTYCKSSASAEHPAGQLIAAFRTSNIHDHLAEKTGKGSELRVW